jgi:methylase of polypeptide subunit release factors
VIAEARRLQRFLPAAEPIPVAAPAGEAGRRLPALVALLTLGRPALAEDARAAIAPALLEDVEATGLITVDGGQVVANYSLLPHDGLLVAGDGPGPADRDLVSPFTGPSLTLARLTPRIARRSMLDLGTGSGVLAVLGAAHCDAVTAVDVNPRALMFARFNAALNGIDNVELLEGSWFEPVAGRRFDLIVGNPPYVLSPDNEFTYRDSGMPGTALLEALCRDTAAHLESGGIGILMASWPHAADDDWAAVPTRWVRDTGCDALILGWDPVDPLQHAVNWNVPPVRFLDPDALRETVARWWRYYREIGAGTISFGAVVLRRRDGGTPWVSALTAPGNPGGRASEQLVRVIEGQDRSRSLDDRALLATRFSLPDGLDVSQRFRRRSGGFVARPAMVSLDAGLGVRAAVDPDALEVLFACDGSRTLIEIAERLAARRGSETGPLAEIAAAAARELLTHGLLEAGQLAARTCPSRQLEVCRHHPRLG